MMMGKLCRISYNQQFIESLSDEKGILSLDSDAVNYSCG